MPRPRTRAEYLSEQAADCMRRGTDAALRGETGLARALLERAWRTAPKDPSIALALANLLLTQGDPKAARLFEEAALQTDMREAWLGLAAALWRSGEAPGAAAALTRALSGHVLPPEAQGVASLASAVARALGLPGWCGVVGWGHPRRHRLLIESEIKPTVRRDGQPMLRQQLRSGRRIDVQSGGIHLLGSPIDLARLRRVEGFVMSAADGVDGWAWCPSDPDAQPVVTFRRGRQTLLVTADDETVTAQRSLTRPRGIHVPQSRLPAGSGVIHVTGSDGRELYGSPLDLAAGLRAAVAISRAAAQNAPLRGRTRLSSLAEAAAPADLPAPPATAPARPDRPVAVVVPVYGGTDLTRDCLDSLLARVDPSTRVIVIDDASPEPDLTRLLDELAGAGRITLRRHRRNLGFPTSANEGLRMAMVLQPEHDVVLLNSDTLLPRHRGLSWLHRLRIAVHARPDVGTATPLSNDAALASYPNRDGPNPVLDRETVARLDRIAARVNADDAVTIPTAVGFCMYVRHECLRETGLFRPHLFAQGYGEENDFCVRASHLGWRHVAVPGVVVAHRGGASFGPARAPLMVRNLAVLERLHPGYRALISAYLNVHPSRDALAAARRRIDIACWAEGRREGAVILVTHYAGGGVERVVRDRCRAITDEGLRAVVLRPVPDPDSTEAASLPGLCQVSDGPDGVMPNLVFRLPHERAALVRLLRADRSRAVEIHHRLGHHPSVMDLAGLLGVPFELRLHDYAVFCPRITLLGADHRYCGEPDDPSICDECVADAGDSIEEGLTAAALRSRSEDEINRASCVIVPSADMAVRLVRHFPRARPLVAVHEDDAAIPAPPPVPNIVPRRVCVIGAIGIEKGFEILLACARDAARRRLDLEFILAGYSVDDARLEQTGRVVVTGRYDEADGLSIIRDTAAHLAFLPSILPETWGFTLGLAWRSGLRAAVFDIGAMSTRVRATGYGWRLPLGLPASAINNVLIAPPTASTMAV